MQRVCSGMPFLVEALPYPFLSVLVHAFLLDNIPELFLSSEIRATLLIKATIPTSKIVPFVVVTLPIVTHVIGVGSLLMGVWWHMLCIWWHMLWATSMGVGWKFTRGPIRSPIVVSVIKCLLLVIKMRLPPFFCIGIPRAAVHR